MKNANHWFAFFFEINSFAFLKLLSVIFATIMNSTIHYSIAVIAKIIRGKLIQQGENAEIKHLLLDSRQILFPDETIFFALESSRRSGMDFVKELYEKGVRNFVVSNSPTEKYSGANFILVKNTTVALQLLAAHHRKQFSISVIGITGSNGKTIVKEWLNQLLETDYKIVRSPKSYNSQIGVPVSVWQMNEQHTLGIFEAGVSQPEEMQNLEKIILPTIGIFTNIGKAHDEGFLNIRQKVNEKLNLFIHCENLIYRKDYLTITECLSAYSQNMKKADKDFPGIKTYTWTTDETQEADVKIRSIKKENSSTKISAEENGKTFSFQIPFVDDASIENAINCRMVMKLLGFSNEKIAERIQLLNSVAMRMEMKTAINHCSLINDSYNSDLNSLRIALDFLQQQKQHAKHTLIISDILQSGLDEKVLYAEVKNLLEKKPVQRIIGIGEAITRQSEIFSSLKDTSTEFFSSTEKFLQSFNLNDFRDETILLKGARQFAFERIGKRLEQKAHETVLEINLDALVHNLNVFRKMLKPQTKVMAMVKAFSYGSGSFEIANLLQHHGVNYLGVAYADEGVELRKAGIALPIMVMNPEPKSYDAIVANSLEPEIYSLNMLRAFVVGVSPTTPLHVHLEIETGMNRLGFDEKDLDELISILASQKNIVVQSIFSHLAASEDESLNEFTFQQIKLFEERSEKIISALKINPLRHLLNTAGISRFPQAHFDMVRLGLGLYGVDSTHALRENLRNVSTLKTTVSQIKKIKEGETIGYSRVGKTQRDTTIATVGIGYADGLSRKLSNGKGFMTVNDKKAFIIGNVCMDMTMLDVTEIENVNEGDEVIVFGENPSVEKIAELAGTISYEIITSVSQRVKRIYFSE